MDELETKRYVSNPLYVDGVQLTAQNLSQVARWCRGRIHKDKHKKTFIKVAVNRPATEKQTRAYPTDWVLKAGSGFKVYNDQAFRNRFKLVQENPLELSPADQKIVSSLVGTTS